MKTFPMTAVLTWPTARRTRTPSPRSVGKVIALRIGILSFRPYRTRLGSMRQRCGCFPGRITKEISPSIRVEPRWTRSFSRNCLLPPINWKRLSQRSTLPSDAPPRPRAADYAFGSIRPTALAQISEFNRDLFANLTFSVKDVGPIRPLIYSIRCLE